MPRPASKSKPLVTSRQPPKKLPAFDVDAFGRRWDAAIAEYGRVLEKWDGIKFVEKFRHKIPQVWKDVLAEAVARLSVLYEKGAPEPSDKEREFWWITCEDNPYLRYRAGGLWIKTKAGVRARMFPNSEQVITVDHAEACWIKGIPCQQIVLKVRQNGFSTDGCAKNSCLLRIKESANAIVVANLDATAKHLLRMAKGMLSGLPEWDRATPDRDNDDEYTLVDEEKGIKEARFDKGSSEKRDKLGRGFTYQLCHCSEVDYYEDATAVFSALDWTDTGLPGNITIYESTGRNRNGLFATMYYEMKDAPEPGQEAFFFAWQGHEEYSKPLAPWQSETAFWAEMDPVLRGKFEAHGCTAAQANWYIGRLAKSRQKGTPFELFRCECPFNEAEAWLEGAASVFPSDMLEADRTKAAAWRPGHLGTVPYSSTAFPQFAPPVYRYARCRLETDAENGFANPRWVDDEFAGEWLVFEKPRRGHVYGIPADLAEGKPLETKSQERDNTALAAWRYTYDPRMEEARFAECCVYAGKIRVPDAARASLALSIMYPGMAGSKATVIFERNNQGIAFVEQGKRDGMEFYVPTRLGKQLEKMEDNYGIQTTGGEAAEASKTLLVSNARDTYAAGLCAIHDPLELQEMGHFGKDKRGRLKGLKGHDDRVSRFYLAIELAKDICDGIIAPQAVYPETDDEIEAEGERLSLSEQERMEDEAFEREMRGLLPGEELQPVGRSAADAGI